MFFHSFKYTMLNLLRDKNQILWSIVFVMGLGTLFQVAFGNMYESDIKVSNIMVSAYFEDEMVEKSFKEYIENVSLDEESGENLLTVTYADSYDEAEELLRSDDSYEGMFYSSDGELKLNIVNSGVNTSILSVLTSKYHQIITVLSEMQDENPERVGLTLGMMLSENSNNVEKKLSDGSMDVYTQYFYNLIAMAALFAVSAGISFTVDNQANLSDLGARKYVSGANAALSTVGGLVACIATQFICITISMLYLLLIGVNFGSNIGGIVVIILIGSTVGVTMGFLIGNVVKGNKSTKEGMGTAVTMTFCFLSGLMVGDMRMIIENSCPIINKINPAALITDSFYALEIYDTYDRFLTNILTLAVISVVFTIAGIIFGRGKKYANI